MNAVAVIAMTGLLATGHAEPIGDGHALLKQCRVVLQWLDGEEEELDKTRTAAAYQCLGFLSGISIANVRTKIMLNTSSDELRCTGGPVDAPTPLTRDDLWALFAVNYCPPTHGSTTDRVRAVVKWLDQHPHRLSDRAGFLVFDALVDSYPCEEQTDN